MSLNSTIVVLSVTTMANGATISSSSYPSDFASGFSGAFIQLAGSSSVTITQQASLDNSNFYDVVDSTGTALGAVASVLTSSVGVYVQFAPVIARWNRFKIVAGAASTVSMSVIMSEQLP